MYKIDAHQHFWQFDPVRDAWITEEMAVIRNDFTPTDLAPLLQQQGYAGCVAVQADQSEKETDFLLNLAAQNDFIRGVVGWLDLRAPNLEERLAHFTRHPRLKGLRHIVQAEPAGFMLQEDFQRGISRLAAYGLTYDILVFPPQIQEAEQLVSRFPGQKFVIDHLAKPYIKDKKIEKWARDMQNLARHPQVFCKLSGMVTEADWQNWEPEDFLPYLETALEAFGPSRLMIGSDWPVCLLAGSYSGVMEIVETYISRLSASEQERILGGTAQEFYSLTDMA